jgi:hypothetical protein
MRFQSTAAALLSVLALAAVPVSAQTAGKKPNILVIFGDDIGYWNIGAYNQGMMHNPPATSNEAKYRQTRWNSLVRLFHNS